MYVTTLGPPDTSFVLVRMDDVLVRNYGTTSLSEFHSWVQQLVRRVRRIVERCPGETD